MHLANSHKLASAMLAGALLAACPAHADVTLQATGTQTMSYSDNPLLAVQNTTGTLWGSTTQPEMLLKDATENSLASLDARIDQNEFNHARYNSTDFHDVANLATKNDHWSASLTQRTDYDTTRTSELTVFGLNPVVAHHTGLSLAPQFAYSPTVTDTLGLSGGVQTSRYDNSAFVNYNNFSATPSWTHAFDPRNSGILEIQTQQYQSTSGARSVLDSAGPMIGWQTVFSPRLSANAAIGAQTSRQFVNGAAVDNWSWNYVFNGGLTFRGEQDSVDLSTQRQQFPYGNGTDALQTNFSLREVHNLNPLVSLNLGLGYLTSSYQASTAGSLKDQASIQAGATYHISEQVDLSATYQYRYETLTTSDATPQDNSVMLSLAFHPKLWTLSP